jgi:CRISPR system Cascade subunit CasD
MDCLILRFDAPLISFGEVAVDNYNPTGRFPSKSMLTGLLGNALGWDHADAALLQDLQSRLRFAARWDAEPEPLTDYQTVDLGQDFLEGTGWTTRGRPEERKGGSAATETHQRWREYWANGVATVALALDGTGAPSLDELEAALRRPARPLFLGRKSCLPAAPLLMARASAQGVRAALESVPLAEIGPRRRPPRIRAIWPSDEGGPGNPEQRFSRRDWLHNIHFGSEACVSGFLGGEP